MTFLLAITLLLDPAPQSQPVSAAPPTAIETAHAPRLHSWLWVPAGGYGLAAFGAGVGASVVGFMRQGAEPFNIRRANTALAVGAAVGLIPGLLLGQQARYEENEKARSSIILLDIVGSIALGFGYAMSHYRLTP
jgi:hypothetical protein